MAKYWPEYIKNANPEENTLTYVYDDLGKRPSVLLALFLFLLGFVPGIIYLIIGGKPAKKYIITANQNGDLKIKGPKTKAIKKSYDKYIQKDGKDINIKKYKGNFNTIITATVVWIIALIAIFIILF
jgi:hypothetical protein